MAAECVAVVLVAGGRGSRAGSGPPKQYRVLGDLSVIARSVQAFLAHPDIAYLQPVHGVDDAALFATAMSQLGSAPTQLRPAVAGGATRQASVLAGLEALANIAPDIVLIHDAARPFVSPALVDRAIAAARRDGAAIPAIPVSDTIKVIDASARIIATPDRATLRAAQTPQAFRFGPLLAAHRQAAASHDTFTDDAAIAEWAGMTVTTFDGEPGNVKLTTADDFEREEMRLNALPDIRTATGFDVHAFGPGDHLWLGGVRIEHSHGLAGHSDADVALHALTDAVLGALADGDIGSHFPPSDPRWKGASSDRFLTDAVARVRARHGVISHLDLTLICEAPKIGPHREAMRARIAAIAATAIGRVAVKATTSERLGFTGRGEGIAALATATIRLPFTEGE